MAAYPDDRRYTREHEWATRKGKFITIGITDFAAEQLGDIVYVELPEEGDEVKKNEPFGVVESVKAVSDLFSPVSGIVREKNDPIADAPETLNEDPYEEGWLIKVEMTSPLEFDELMTADEYEAFIREGEE